MIALHKDPEGTTMFSKQQRASSCHSQPQNRSSFSLSVQKKFQSADQSTTSEVESLKKRINELESKLTSMQEVQEYNHGTPSVNHEKINVV